jgi:SAM-dependent methyltransferase
MQHPFEGEGFTNGRIKEYWDEIADSYSPSHQGDIPNRIVSFLVSKGILNSEKTVLELGSGPGTYSLKIAPVVKRLTCVDSSARMLARLQNDATEHGTENMDYVNSDFKDLSEDRKSDVVVSALCPGTGTEESVRLMESLAFDYCVHIMWLENQWDNVQSEMWKGLGKDYSYSVRNTKTITDVLDRSNRDYHVEEFVCNVESESDLESAVAKGVRTFGQFDIKEDPEPSVRNALKPYAYNGTVRFSWTNRMRLLYWSPE